MDCFSCPYLSLYKTLNQFGEEIEEEGCCRVTNECPFINNEYFDELPF